MPADWAEEAAGAASGVDGAGTRVTEMPDAGAGSRDVRGAGGAISASTVGDGGEATSEPGGATTGGDGWATTTLPGSTGAAAGDAGGAAAGADGDGWTSIAAGTIACPCGRVSGRGAAGCVAAGNWGGVSNTNCGCGPPVLTCSVVPGGRVWGSCALISRSPTLSVVMPSAVLPTTTASST
jgi:hypothetical protein